MLSMSLMSWIWLGVALIAFIAGNDLWGFTAITNSTVWLVGQELDRRWSA